MLNIVEHCRLSLAFKTAVWGFPTVGIAHGRTAEHDCSGDFCYGLHRYWAPGVPVVTLRAPLDGWLRSWQRHVHRIDAPLKFFLVQRSRKLSRRLVAPERLASSWSRALRGQLKITLWRPEMYSILQQARMLYAADALAAVTGQACGLGIFLRRKRILLEFTPAIDGSYGCRWGWDMNPTSEVGQIGRLGELHHHCVMSLAVGVAERTTSGAKRSAELALASRTAGDILTRAEASFTWRTAAKVVPPSLGSGRLRRVLRQAVHLVRSARRQERAAKDEKSCCAMAPRFFAYFFRWA